MLFLINLKTKCKTNLKNYFKKNFIRNLFKKLFTRHACQQQDMLVNIKRKIINTAIVTINIIKTITMPIIYFI